MNDGVVKKVEQHLLYQHGVHLGEDDAVRHGDGHRDVGIALFEVNDGLADDLLKHFVLKLERARLPVGHARDGEKIFDHAAQPLRVLLRVGEKLAPLRVGKRALIVQHDADIAADGGERRAQVMRNGAEEIGARLFPFRIRFLSSPAP